MLRSVHSGFEKALEFPEREPKKTLWFWKWEQNPNETRIFPLILEIFSFWKKKNVFRNCLFSHKINKLIPGTKYLLFYEFQEK